MITGESSPVAKREGDPVCGGTANQHGSVLMRAERVGEETMLAQVTKMWRKGGRAPRVGLVLRFAPPPPQFINQAGSFK